MKNYIAQLPDHCQKGWELGSRIDLTLTPAFNSVLILGMGGSAIGGDVASVLLEERAEIPVIVNRDYKIPNWVNKGTLVVASSYSGDSEEVLASLAQAQKRACPLLAISSGGKLSKEFPGGENLARIPLGLPPRTTIGYVLFTILALFDRLKIAHFPLGELEECYHVLESIKEENEGILEGRQAFLLAGHLKNKFPLVYGTVGTGAVAAARWKGQLNENSKVMASNHDYPELSHNEAMGWQDTANLTRFMTVLHLIDEGVNGRIKAKMDICKKVLQEKNIPVHEVFSRGTYPLTRVMSLIMLGDYVSFYLAQLYGVDPMPIDIIEDAKKELANWQKFEGGLKN